MSTILNVTLYIHMSQRKGQPIVHALRISVWVKQLDVSRRKDVSCLTVGGIHAVIFTSWLECFEFMFCVGFFLLLLVLTMLTTYWRYPDDSYWRWHHAIVILSQILALPTHSSTLSWSKLSTLGVNVNDVMTCVLIIPSKRHSCSGFVRVALFPPCQMEGSGSPRFRKLHFPVGLWINSPRKHFAKLGGRWPSAISVKSVWCSLHTYSLVPPSFI